MEDLLQKYKEEQLSKGEVCENYLKRWDRCLSNKDFFEMACEIQASEYLVKSLSEGNSVLTAEYISERFKHFINGQYITNVDDKYTSEMWCNVNGGIKVRSTLVSIISCDIHIEIEPNSVCRVLVSSDSKADFFVPKSSELIVVYYGTDWRNIIVDSNSEGKYKLIDGNSYGR